MEIELFVFSVEAFQVFEFHENEAKHEKHKFKWVFTVSFDVNKLPEKVLKFSKVLLGQIRSFERTQIAKLSFVNKVDVDNDNEL